VQLAKCASVFAVNREANSIVRENVRRFLLFLCLFACAAKQPPPKDALFVNGPCYTPPHGLGEAVEDPPYNNTQHLPVCPDRRQRFDLSLDGGLHPMIHPNYLFRDGGLPLFARDAGVD